MPADQVSPSGPDAGASARVSRVSENAPATGRDPSTRGTRIVVADDDRDVLDLVRVRLQAAGYDVAAAADGHAGLEAISAQRPALAVLDVTMPRLGGLELTRRLRVAPATARLPIILLAARTSEEEIAQGYAAGADAYLPKPFRANELVALVAVLLARQPSERP